MQKLSYTYNMAQIMEDTLQNTDQNQDVACPKKDCTTSICSLCCLTKGHSAKITKIQSDNPIVRNRLLSLGLVEGRQLQVTHRSPMGGTICIELIGCSLALRQSEAEAISVEI